MCHSRHTPMVLGTAHGENGQPLCSLWLLLFFLWKDFRRDLVDFLGIMGFWGENSMTTYLLKHYTVEQNVQGDKS